MTVKELIEALQKFDPELPVGSTMSCLHGWVSNIDFVTQTEDGKAVCLDSCKSDETLFPEESDIVRSH